MSLCSLHRWPTMLESCVFHYHILESYRKKRKIDFCSVILKIFLLTQSLKSFKL